uniref:Uncharacterized protein n=1 Tax=uncultured Alphaproteobacteria bacterium TaxID=91750 RepID=A0A6G8F1R4_9PROT|nr:hypothetical protein PlAlph_0290 [uncultured Alphaproteobacteria bacterium]
MPSEINFGLPAGTNISQIGADGGLLYILVSENGQNRHIIIFSPEKGKIISNMTLN